MIVDLFSFIVSRFDLFLLILNEVLNQWCGRIDRVKCVHILYLYILRFLFFCKLRELVFLMHVTEYVYVC